jgi:hypothetical protein
MIGRSAVLALVAIGLLAGCSAGVKRTPGMKLYSSGNIAEAVPLLEQEVAAGEVSARYPLGLAYRDGQGVARDPVKAEVLLTGAAIGGDPRAVTALRELLAQANRCSKDAELRSYWGGRTEYRVARHPAGDGGPVRGALPRRHGAARSGAQPACVVVGDPPRLDLHSRIAAAGRTPDRTRRPAGSIVALNRLPSRAPPPNAARGFPRLRKGIILGQRHRSRRPVGR